MLVVLREVVEVVVVVALVRVVALVKRLEMVMVLLVAIKIRNGNDMVEINKFSSGCVNTDYVSLLLMFGSACIMSYLVTGEDMLMIDSV